MHKPESVNRPIMAVAVLLMLVLVMASSFAADRLQAASETTCLSVAYFTYYTNANKTTVCGYYDDCSGVASGCHTAYYTKKFVKCCT